MRIDWSAYWICESHQSLLRLKTAVYVLNINIDILIEIVFKKGIDAEML